MKNLNVHRWALVAALAAMAAIAMLFYGRQNAGLQPGGAISLPKMLWLTYAVTAWLIIPLFLWRDATVAPAVRRLFKWFWIAMAARAGVELIMIYGFHHWHPLYAISHDLFCIALLLLMQRRLPPVDGRDRHARCFVFSLIVTLCAETVFASMFLQTQAAAGGIYFASADASWGFINLLTVAVLCFALPDFVLMLIRLYLPGTASGRRKTVEVVRIGLGLLTIVIVCAALAFWMWMDNYEQRTKRFQTIGYQIADACKGLSAAFYAADRDALAAFILDCDVTWGRQDVAHDHPFEMQRWTDSGEKRALLDAMYDLRQGFPDLKECIFKIHLIDKIHSDTDVALQLRFELVGRSGTDFGLLRCRFRKSDNGRWQIGESSLIQGTSVTAEVPLFKDLGAASGLDFVLNEDRRFAPGSVCTEHECTGPTQLKFQTMRYAYAGASAADVDNDGLDDVFFCSGDRTALYRNLGGRFENVTAAAGLENIFHVNTAGFADLDGDGDQDLFLGAFYGQCCGIKNKTPLSTMNPPKLSGCLTVSCRIFPKIPIWTCTPIIWRKQSMS